METENISKTEFKYLQLIDKLEQTCEKYEMKVKQLDNENTGLLNKLDLLKQESIKLSSINNSLRIKVSEIEKECNNNTYEAQEHIDSIEAEIEEAHELILNIREYVLADKQVLTYFGRKADVIFEEAYKNGLAVLKSDYLKEKNFPRPLLIELENEDFCLMTSSFKLVKSGEEEYILTKISNKDENKIEIKEN